MSISNKVAWNTIVQVLGKAASTTLGVIITILLTRYLGVAGFGTYTFVLVFVTMFGTLSDWGMNLITIREASKNPDKAGEIIGNIFVIRLVLATIAAIASVIAINFLPYDSKTQLLVSLASFYLLALSVKTSFQIIFNVKLQLQNWAISEFSANASIILMVIFLISQKADISYIIIAAIIGHFIAATIAAFLGYRLLRLKFSLNGQYTKHLLWESLPMGAILVLFTVYNRIDTIILSLFKGQEAVGLYGAAYRIYEVLILGAAYFANSILPLISNYAVTDREKLKVIFKKSYVLLLLVGIFIALINFLLAPIGIAVIAGPKFAGAVPALQILSLALIVSYFNHINGYTLIALGKQWSSFRIAAAALTVNLILNLLFIPIFSFPAAALITFITESLVVLMSLYVIKKELGIIPAPSDIIMVSKEIIQKKGQIF